MKKLLAGALALTMLLPCMTAAYAEDGVAGHIYSTDILAYVNGQPIESYNIGGKTVVIAEDLEGEFDYGFTYFYNDEERLLSVRSDFHAPYQEHEAIPRGETGQILGDVYNTDIKVMFNGIEIPGYNIGGRTAVCIEEIGDTTGSPHEAYGYSKYLANYVWDPTEKTISLNSYMDNSDDLLGLNQLSRVAFTFSDNVIYAQSDDDTAWSRIYPSINGVRQEAEEGAYTYYYTEEFGDQKYVMSPLYLDANGSRMEIGTCVALWDKDAGFDRTYLHIADPAAALALATSVKTPVKTYDEAITYLTEKYELIDRIDNDAYTVLLLKDEDDSFLVYAAKKTGGYAKLGEYPAEKSVGILFGDSEGEAIVTVYPYTDNHGQTVTLNEIHQLDMWYRFD